MWLNCPGAPNAQDGKPDSSSHFAREGTVAHALGQICLESGDDPIIHIGEFVDDEVTDICVDHEMVGYVHGYVEYVHSLGKHIHVEQRVDFSPWTVEDQFGTADAIAVNKNVMHVVDLKYGKGIQVYAENNTQGMLYALGSYNDYGWLYPDVDTITIHIYQPRKAHYDEWTISLEQLIEWGENVCKPAAAATVEADAPRVPGDKQCTWCKARGDCAALARYNLDIAVDEFTDIDGDMELVNIEQLTPVEIGVLVPHIDRISKWCDAVKSEAMELLTNGTDVPGYKLVEGSSNRRFIDAEQAEKWLKRKIKSGDLYKKKMLTLAQAEKLLSKDEKDLFKKYWEKPPGKPALAVTSDKREAIEYGDAAHQSAESDFDDI